MQHYAAGGELTEVVMDDTKEMFSSFEIYRQKIRHGDLGKTPQYWLMYLDMMRMQHVIHTAVQENNFEARLCAWKYFIPFYFAFNKINYARYGSFYLESLKSIGINYPDLKEMLAHAGLSVQGQEKYALRTAVDQRGEQTIN